MFKTPLARIFAALAALCTSVVLLGSVLALFDTSADSAVTAGITLAAASWQA